MIASEIREAQDVVFAMDDVTLDSKALWHTYTACEAYILSGIGQEELEGILHALSTMIYELDKELDDLMEKGYAALRRKDIAMKEVE